MKDAGFGSWLALLAMLSGCGGGSTSQTAAVTPPVVTPPVATTPATCSLRDRQNWAKATLDEWYLFPETLPATLDPAPYTSVEDYIDALTATARSQNKDRYFSYLTSIKDEDAYYESGASAGYGFRLAADSSGTRVFIIESFENTPALAAGIDRGDEITAIGTTPSNLKTVSAIALAGGTTRDERLNAVGLALGPDTNGTSRTFTVVGPSGTRTVTVTEAPYDLTPVSARYGAKVLTDSGRKIGYLNFRTFIGSAEQPLRNAFADFRTQGITEFVIDLRYNGGGSVDVAELLARLLGGNRSTGDVIEKLTYRPEKTSQNTTANFAPQPESVSPVKIAFIGTEGTASASELTINAFVPYLGSNVALIGTNTYGKPVGQVAIDRTECDDRFRVIAFAVENAAGTTAYFDGLKSVIPVTCQADDDIAYPLGDPREDSLRAAIGYLNGQSCTAIASAKVGATASIGRQAAVPTERVLLMPKRPNTPQREVPGSF